MWGGRQVLQCCEIIVVTLTLLFLFPTIFFAPTTFNLIPWAIKQPHLHHPQHPRALNPPGHHHWNLKLIIHTKFHNEIQNSKKEKKTKSNKEHNKTQVRIMDHRVSLVLGLICPDSCAFNNLGLNKKKIGLVIPWAYEF